MKYLIYSMLFVLMACKDRNEALDHSPGNDLLSVVSEAIKQNPLNPELRFKRAQLLAELERYPEGIEDMRLAIIRDSMQARYYHLLSDLFMDSNNSSKSLLTMKTAAKLFSDSVKTQLKLAENQYILKQYGDAILTINELIRKQPQNAEAYFMLGQVFKESGEIAKAINAYQTATELDSKLTDAWINLGLIFEAKNENIALRYFKTATEVDPQNIAALHSLAFYLQNHVQIDEAIEVYKNINSIDPNYADAYLNAGILYLEKGKNQQALEQFDILTKVDITNAKGFYFKAYTLSKLGDNENAKINIQTALNIDPGYTEALELKDKISR